MSWIDPLVSVFQPKRKRYKARTHRKVRIGRRVFPSAVVAAQVLGYSESYVRTLIYRKQASYIFD